MEIDINLWQLIPWVGDDVEVTVEIRFEENIGNDDTILKPNGEAIWEELSKPDKTALFKDKYIK